ncbi:hypothetical protein BA895_17485 [Humibacillus sp. DSM 29435]|uniref:hypothetical protein n=1 Tax=Humibacillus sp. DSM 29435 TaxID=1869167 RepID=UPI000872DEE5|nr:hypothetical protein [Humibacillus sp. DSM 29435]OFE17233.1 hypothetical protein BA895_17485 [Humibacillus sp. DSM 29435]
MLVLRNIGDIFRSDDLGGVALAGWMPLMLVTPWRPTASGIADEPADVVPTARRVVGLRSIA